jgi:predicted Zn-dependent protease
MHPLDGKDNKHILAAEGWLDLGDYASANAELDEITPQRRGDWEVLAMRCLVYRQAEKWDYLLALSQSLATLDPQNVSVWIHYAEALHGLGRTEEAIALLSQKIEEFSDPTYPYYLACYTAKLGRIKEAREWLKRTFDTDLGTTAYRKAALENPDLEPVWRDFEG